MIYTGHLTKGDTVLLVAPSSPLRQPATAETCAEGVRLLGYRVKMGKSLYSHTEKGYAAAPAQIRADDINNGFADPEINAIWAVRGGSMAMEVIPLLDFDVIRNNPKPLIGFSDITALHIALQEKCGLVSFHALCASHIIDCGTDSYAVRSLMRLMNMTGSEVYRNPGDRPLNILCDGTAEGELVGGNLSLVAALCGTKYALHAEGKLLFLEDVGEDVYRLNRLLLQLKLSGMFERVKGIVFGAFTNCVNCYVPEYDPEHLIHDMFCDCGKPVYTGLSVGHIRDNGALPLGMHCKMREGALYFEPELF